MNSYPILPPLNKEGRYDSDEVPGLYFAAGGNEVHASPRFLNDVIDNPGYVRLEKFSILDEFIYYEAVRSKYNII